MDNGRERSRCMNSNSAACKRRTIAIAHTRDDLYGRHCSPARTPVGASVSNSVASTWVTSALFRLAGCCCEPLRQLQKTLIPAAEQKSQSSGVT
jgi:hypothetical protein